MAKHLSTYAIEMVAGRIAEGVFVYDDDLWAALKRVNDEGWTVEKSAPLGGVVRFEGVHLSDDNLRVAMVLGEAWLRGENTHAGYGGYMTVTEARALAA